MSDQIDDQPQPEAQPEINVPIGHVPVVMFIGDRPIWKGVMTHPIRLGENVVFGPQLPGIFVAKKVVWAFQPVGSGPSPVLVVTIAPESGLQVAREMPTPSIHRP